MHRQVIVAEGDGGDNARLVCIDRAARRSLYFASAVARAIPTDISGHVRIQDPTLIIPIGNSNLRFLNGKL